MKSAEFKASTVEEAIEKGLNELNKKMEEVDIEIAEVGGFLKKAKVIITVKPTEGEKAFEFVNKLLEKMNFNISAQLVEDEEKVIIKLSGEDSGKIIGYRGDVLDSVQYLTTIAVNKSMESFKKIIIDCENYRLKREETLTSLAGKLAEKAIGSGRKVSLEPMNPFERRIIHSALQNNQDVSTESEGSEPNRFVVITPKNLKQYSRYDKDDRPQRKYDRKPDNEKYNKERPKEGYNSTPRSKSNGFGGFGTYLGNTKSGFSADNNFIKKSGFDNLKD